MQKTKAERPKSFKPAILEAALHLFAENGYAATSVAEISKRSGAAEGTIFHHYRSKDELFLLIVKDIEDKLTSRLRSEVTERRFENGMAMVEATISLYLDMASEMTVEFAFLFRNRFFLVAGEHPIYKSHFESIHGSFVDMLKIGLSIGRRDGSIVACDEEPTAVIIFAALNGLTLFNVLNLQSVEECVAELKASVGRMLAPR